MTRVKMLVAVLLLSLALAGVGTVTAQNPGQGPNAAMQCPPGFSLMETTMGGVEGGDMGAAGDQAGQSGQTGDQSGAAGAIGGDAGTGDQTGANNQGATGDQAGAANNQGTTGDQGMGSAESAENLCVLMSHLSGPDEMHDPDGTGTALISFNLGTNEVCYRIQVANITLPATDAHIHIGGPGVEGPPVIPIGIPDESGYVEGCTDTATPDVINAVRADPFGYYVNVHTPDFPNGAVRGQLSGTFALSGAQGDSPAAGDVNARGNAFATLNRERSEMCYGFWTEGLSAPATSARLYTGTSGQDGQPALDLSLPSDRGLTSGCTALDPALFDQIAQNPHGYYFGLANDQFQTGALRGQWPTPQSMNSMDQGGQQGQDAQQGDQGQQGSGND